MNYLIDNGPGLKKHYNKVYCELCEDTREIYKWDIPRYTNGCNQCNKNVFNQVLKTLSFIPEENYIYYYNRYKTFIRRAYDRGQKHYLDYGARGILVDVEWKGNSNINLETTAKAFKLWLEWAFSFGEIKYLTLERIDNNQAYSKQNCEYIALENQGKNKRNSWNNTKGKSIYKGVCWNKNYWMVCYFDKINTKSITISNKNYLQDEIEAAIIYDNYLESISQPVVNKPLINIVKYFNFMFKEQDKLNTYINSNWKQEGLNFDLYTQVESIEGIQSFSFKHWKKGKEDFKNAEMELVDIMFFTISSCLLSNFSAQDFAYYYNLGILNNANTKKDPKYLVKLFQDITYYSLQNNLSSIITCLGYLTDTLNMTAIDIYKLYIAKHVLNIFRQNNGYKEGTYIKEWPSIIEPSSLVEDNVYLEMFLTEQATQDMFENAPEKVFDYLYNKLNTNYPG